MARIYDRYADRLHDFCVGMLRDADGAAWRNYWKRVGEGARSGIWHETFLVRAGEYEAVDGDMPTYGLAKAGTVAPIATSSRARVRLGKRD